MPIPLFTTEKPSQAEVHPQTSTDPTTVTSTPLTSGSNLSERRRSSASEHTNPAAGHTADSAASSGREQTREEREEAERIYMERMEDEYAKREGGA